MLTCSPRHELSDYCSDTIYCHMSSHYNSFFNMHTLMHMCAAATQSGYTFACLYLQEGVAPPAQIIHQF